MKSQQILPLKNRLDKFQINELEGFAPKYSRTYFGASVFSKDELLLKYHKALIEAEKELENSNNLLDLIRE